jgi:hypothetical protein
MKYRRRMKPAVVGSSLVWKPEYPDNDDGSNEQPSFALSAQIATDDRGMITGAHRDVQAVSYAGQSEDLWQKMFGTRFTDASTNSMLALTDKYRVVRKIEAITDDNVDEEMLDEILEDFQGAAVTQGVPQALEQLFILFRKGMNRPAVGIKRVPDKCGHCKGNLFQGSQPCEPGPVPAAGADLDFKICPFCNCWLHRTCAETHMVQHVKGTLCRGSRRWKDRKTTRAFPGQEWIVGSGFSHGAPAVPVKPKLALPVRSGASSRFGNLPPEGLTMMPADYDEDDLARSSGDPMAEFHAERPAIDHESWEDRLNEQKEGDRSRLRSDTSDEEFLDTLSYCGQCGSDACWREKDACRLLQKASLQKLLLAGFLADVPVQSGMTKFVKGRIADFMLQASTEILQRDGRRVTERQQMKLSNYARKQKCQRGDHDLQFDVEKGLPQRSHLATRA